MKNNNSDIYIKFSTLPDELRSEVIDFIEFLQKKYLSTQNKKPKRKAGLAKGLIKMRDNFDEPLEDFKDYM